VWPVAVVQQPPIVHVPLQDDQVRAPKLPQLQRPPDVRRVVVVFDDLANDLRLALDDGEAGKAERIFAGPFDKLGSLLRASCFSRAMLALSGDTWYPTLV